MHQASVSGTVVDILFSRRRRAGGSSKDPHQGEQPRDANANGRGGVKEEWREPGPVALSLTAVRTPPPERVRAHWTSKTGKRPSQPISGELSSLVACWWPDEEVGGRCADSSP